MFIEKKTYGRYRMRSYIWAEEYQDSISADLDRMKGHTVLESFQRTTNQTVKEAARNRQAQNTEKNRLVVEGAVDTVINEQIMLEFPLLRIKIVRYLIWLYRDRNPRLQARADLNLAKRVPGRMI